MADSIYLHQSLSLSPFPQSMTSFSSHSLLTYPSSSLSFQRQCCEVHSDQWIVPSMTRNCDRYTKLVNKLHRETHSSLTLQQVTKIRHIPRTTVRCIQHAVSGHQHRAKPLESAGVSVMYTVHEAAYNIVVNGHNICNICKQRIPDCPICR